jgi:subtilisin family serine protease
MRTYTVLRDLTAASTGEPFGGAASMDTPDLGSVGLGVDVERLDKSDVRSLSRDPAVGAIAPVMPTTLIHPVGEPEDGTTEATGTAWGVNAVGADRSSRTGAGVVVALLDTGIDASHPAFTDVQLIQMDFSGSGNGDKQGHGTHCAGTVFGRDVDGTRIGVAPGGSQELIGKVLGDNSSGDSDMIFRGIQWALDNRAQVIMATPHVAAVTALWWEELVASDVPLAARATLAKLLATATTAGLAQGVDPADRGPGIVQAP